MENFKKRLRKAVSHLDHVFAGRADLTEAVIAEVNELLTLGSKDERIQAYKDFTSEYDALVFHAWDKKPVADKAFAFLDEVLSVPEISFSEGLILRIIISTPNKNLVRLIENHRQKFLEKREVLLQTAVRVHRFGVWPPRHMTRKDKDLLKELVCLLENNKKNDIGS